MASRKRTTVGWPMTPAMVLKLGAIDAFPQSASNFKPTDEWTHTYRIWTCHGYIESGNESVGYLKIERKGGPNRTFVLNVEQKIVQSEGDLHVLRAKVQCRRDPLCSPTAWTLTSTHYGTDGKIQRDLSTEKQARRTNDTIETMINGKTAVRKIPTMTLTADWCLFEAVQRLPFEDTVSLGFDMLEGLSIMRPDHKLTYRGAPEGKSSQVGGLRGFQQLGLGRGPCEWWLDDKHRLVMASMFARVYLLDDKAESILAKALASSRAEYTRKSERGK